MLDLGSAFGDKTLTIRFVTLENPEIFGRKYPVIHLDEVMANLTFLDSRRKRVKFCRYGLNLVELKYINRWSRSSASIRYLKEYKKIIEKISMDFFRVKNWWFFWQNFTKIDDMTLVNIVFSHLKLIIEIFMAFYVWKITQIIPHSLFKGATMGRDFGDDRKKWPFFMFFAHNVTWVHFSNF